jgi:transposase
MVLAERARADRMAQILKEMQRYRFGRRAETLPLDQLELGLEEVQQVEAAESVSDNLCKRRCGSLIALSAR